MIEGTSFEDTAVAMEQETTNQPAQQKTDYIEEKGLKYFPFTASFEDMAGEGVDKTYHFRSPQRMHVMRIANAGKEKVFDSQKEVVIELALPAERDSLREFFEEYPMVATSFGDLIFKSAGAGSVSRGK